MFKKISLTSIMVLLLTACSIKEAKKQESAFIVMKTPTIKFADMGFIYDSGSKIKVEVYATGQPLVDLEINTQNICLSLMKCMEKKDFNKEVLSEAYPDTLLENIFRGKPIFEAKNLEKKEGGFVQKISKAEVYEISYSVVSTQRVFRDTINKIVIKVREQ
ncbi:MAG: Putative lipoprotein [uncultured Sulfurovum sp.]|uniref:Lipoprotein n=1 Tax=uncultured Sulfurovum sp. TaxID=269237 RepID=A0A6S6TK88_9BACT|nr:MAG: Putative lipoprotein [uncultured Sulfurovum sp.]